MRNRYLCNHQSPVPCVERGFYYSSAVDPQTQGRSLLAPSSSRHPTNMISELSRPRRSRTGGVHCCSTTSRGHRGAEEEPSAHALEISPFWLGFSSGLRDGSTVPRRGDSPLQARLLAERYMQATSRTVRPHLELGKAFSDKTSNGYIVVNGSPPSALSHPIASRSPLSGGAKERAGIGRNG